MQNKISTLFVGIDIHKETHTLVGTNIVCEPMCQLTFDNNQEGFNQALRQVYKTAKAQNLKPLFGLEDSGGNGLALARFLANRNELVKTVNPVLVDRNRQYSTHPEKSDPRDALGIAEVLIKKTSQLPTFILTHESEFAKDLTFLVKERENLVCEQTKLKNKLVKYPFFKQLVSLR